ncbi:MAG: hypothetical protein ACK5L6_07495 [Anaerorhabdus sp.]|uniref:hypothetical protein n=1 Tax=Anaerorhabdus sp. TaxID=1872524 RepID=UPI003A8A3556
MEAKLLKELKEFANVNHNTVYAHCKKLGISVAKPTKRDVKILKESLATVKKKKEKIKKDVEIAHNIVIDKTTVVERISNSKAAALSQMYIDSKEEYDFNRFMINQLQQQIEGLNSLVVDNGNGTVSIDKCVVQLEKFVKLNIALRNQIVLLEEKLAIGPEKNDETPFDD